MKCSVYIATSLDGFIAREDGALDWLPQPGEEEIGEAGEEHALGDDHGFYAFMASVDALVMGRNTYETVRSFGGEWPYGEKPVIVLSSRPVDIPQRLAKTVEASASPPAPLVAELAARGMTHLYIDGGRTIQSFLNAGLIDQLIITRVPVLIGRGIPLFGPLVKDITLRHIDTNVLPGGMVQSRYAVYSEPGK